MTRTLTTLVSGVADPGVPDRYDTPTDVTKAELDRALTAAIDRIGDNLDTFSDCFPAASSDDLVYGTVDNMGGWTTSFWTGLCWLAYEVTGEARFRKAAEAQLKTFERRLDEGLVDTHDLGFLYTLSAIASHRLTDNEQYRTVAIRAADLLVDRYWEAPGLLQAWGPMDDPDDENRGRMIADTMMNLPLLFWASEATDDPSYAEIAASHARANVAHIVRDDASTFHTFTCDVETGEPLGGETAQGHADDSCWSRGQTWVIYGGALAADYTGEGAHASLAAKVADYYLTHVEDDHVPLWDFDAPTDPEIRDSSAAAIAACGLDELTRQLPTADERVPAYRTAALETLGSLAADYTTGEDSNGLLKAGAYHPTDDDYDECTIWGDYFYVEGLVRATRQHTRFW